MLQGLKDYFHFSKGERKGIFILLAIIVLILLIKQYFISFEPEYFAPRKELAALQAKLDSLSLANQEKQNKSIKKAENEVVWQPERFNPNNYKQKDWQKLGLSPKQAQVILNYKEKAGGFKSKQQIKKLFVISDELYDRIEDFIVLPDTLERKTTFSKKESDWSDKPLNSSFKKRRALVKVRINTADTAQLKKLYGIGNVLSQRIVERREALGGFYSKEQLKEIWGIKAELLKNLDTLLILDEVTLKKLSINNATKEELKAHPYLYWKHANAIVNYRKQHGLYQKLDDLNQIKIISDSLLFKVKPYLTL